MSHDCWDRGEPNHKSSFPLGGGTACPLLRREDAHAVQVTHGQVGATACNSKKLANSLSFVSTANIESKDFFFA